MMCGGGGVDRCYATEKEKYNDIQEGRATVAEDDVAFISFFYI